MTTEIVVQLEELSWCYCTVGICERSPQCCCLFLATIHDCVLLPSCVLFQDVVCVAHPGWVVIR